MFKKKTELPIRQKMPTMNQLLEDVENAPMDDPVFVGGLPPQPPPEDNSKPDSFTIAQEFMATTQRLKELELLLLKQKTELEENHKELLQMVGNILQEAVTLK